MRLLLTSLPPNYHGQDAPLLFVFVLDFVFFSGLAFAFGGARTRFGDEIGQSRIFQNIRSGIANVQKDLIQSAMRQVAVDEHAQLLGVAKWGERAVYQTHNLAQPDFTRFPAQLVAAFGSTNALNHARVLKFEEDEFQKLFREILFVGDFTNFDGALVMMTGEHHHGLERVETFLRYFHGGDYAIKSIVLVDFIYVEECSKRRSIPFNQRKAVKSLIPSVLLGFVGAQRKQGCASDCSRRNVDCPMERDYH